MDLHDFIRLQGEYADRVAGKGQRNLGTIDVVNEVLTEIGDLHEEMLETFNPEINRLLQASWFSVAFFAFDAARRLGAGSSEIDEGMHRMLLAIDEVVKENR